MRERRVYSAANRFGNAGLTSMGVSGLQRIAWVLTVLVPAVYLLHGCEAPLPDTPPSANSVNTDDLWAQWHAIAVVDPTARNVEEAVRLTSLLAKEEDGLLPMVSLVSDMSVPAQQKIFATICLTTQRDQLAPFESQLRAGSAEGVVVETRKFSTHLLGLLDTPGALAAMDTLLEDSDRSVREAAMGVLLTFHPERVVDRIQPFWDAPETTPAIRDQVVLGMPPQLVEQFLDIFSDAVNDTSLSPTARMKAVSVLGQLGDAQHIDVLERCMSNDPDAAVQARARGAVALLRAAGNPQLPAVE